MRSDPFSPAMQRLAATVGFGFVLLTILSIVFGGGDTPDYDAPAGEWASWAQDDEDAAQLGSVLLCLACFQLLWFVGYLRGQLGRAEEAARGFSRMSHIVFAGGIVAVVGLVLSAAMNTAAASQPEGTPDEIVRALGVLSYYPFFIASVGLGTMLYTAGFMLLRVQALPRWLAYVGLVGGIAFLVTLFVQLSPDDDGGAIGISYPIGFLSLLVFVTGASVAFLRDIDRSTPATATTAP